MSALIHAATMVTAGVYLVVRSHAIFEGAPNAQLAVAIVGAITLLYGAIVGCAKDDIKKALAASTMSQIGYMMLAAGWARSATPSRSSTCSPTAFQGRDVPRAGSVMHGMNDQVDMRRFGRLSGAMKVTWVTFWPGLARDPGHPALRRLLVQGQDHRVRLSPSAARAAGSSAWPPSSAPASPLSTCPAFFMTFHGKEKRWTDGQHPHESPATMTVPMIVLSIGSGLLGMILAFAGFAEWLHPVFGGEEHEEHTNWPLMAITLLVVAAGLLLAYWRYWREEVPKRAPEGNLLTQAARADLYQDAINEGLFMPGPAST